MCRLYVLVSLIFFSMPAFSMSDEPTYSQLESELEKSKSNYEALKLRCIFNLKKMQNKLSECCDTYDNDLAVKDNELTALTQRTTLLENQLAHARSFEGWLSHRVTLPACTSIIVLAAYKKFAIPRLHAWAQKIRRPTWKKRVFQLLACDWLQRVRFVRRRGKKKGV